jgi:FkbM family methyltransferase
MYYSQTKTIEPILDSLFQNPGTFLEIGCWDGELISQTAYLERERGWTGVCVDPFPRNFQDRRCQVCARAVGANGDDVREFLHVSTDRRDGGDVSYFSGFRDSVRAHLPLIEAYCNYEIVHVPTITFQQLYTCYQLPAHIEFLSVDVEGSELEIFQSIDFHIHSFGLITFEHNEDQETRERIGEILMQQGYRLMESWRVDDIYINGSME